MPTVDITTSPTRLIGANRKRTSLIINNLSGNLAVGVIEDPTLNYSQKSLEITGGANYSISLDSSIVGYENDGTPIFTNQRWVTSDWWLISSSGTQTVSYQDIYR